MSEREAQTCKLCNNKPSKYCCPRCGVFYCSVVCYKSENHQVCSEAFYEECVRQEMTSHETDETSRRKMMDILKKINDEDLGMEPDEDSCGDSDDENYLSLEQRLEDIQLDNSDDLWNALTVDERNEFQALMNSGNIESFVNIWEPWWAFKEDKQLIQSTSDSPKISIKEVKYPDIVKVKDFTDVTNIKPSEFVKYNILNVIASFALVARYLNGEYHSQETVSLLLAVSKNLDKNHNFANPQSAVDSIEQECLVNPQIHIDKESIEMMKHDIFCILNGPSESNRLLYVQCCLSEIHKICQGARFWSKNNTGSKKNKQSINCLPTEDIKKLKIIEKKIEYFLSYVNLMGLNLFKP